MRKTNNLAENISDINEPLKLVTMTILNYYDDDYYYYYSGIALTQKSCIFTQIKSKKCIIEILMRPRTQGTTCFYLSVYYVVCKTVGAICDHN